MTDLVTYAQRTTGGKAFRCSQRTADHLDWTKSELARRLPDARLLIVQGCYNTGVKASAGTHDYDAVLDVKITGVSWWAAQRFLRECGWAAWYRYPPTFAEHIHMVSLGYETKVGRFVPGQVSDYYAHRNGLAGHAHDDSWHPADIDSTIFKEDDMPLSDEDVQRIADAVWAKRMKAFGNLTIGTILRNIARAVGAADK